MIIKAQENAQIVRNVTEIVQKIPKYISQQRLASQSHHLIFK